MKLSLFLMLLMSYQATVHCYFLQSPIVVIELSDSGFHRDLQYIIKFDYPLTKRNCEYALEQPLPAAVYVSVDQLDDLQRLNKLNAVYPKFVDIEAQAQKSQPFSVLLKGTPKSSTTDTIKLPIHFRYQAPSQKRSFVTVQIDSPRMFMHCEANEGVKETNQMHEDSSDATTSLDFCLHTASSSFRELSQFSDELPADDDCDWKLVNVKIILKAPLNAEIPVGNEKALPAILYVTIIISWIMALWTVIQTSENPWLINQQLEEQRILKNK